MDIHPIHTYKIYMDGLSIHTNLYGWIIHPQESSWIGLDGAIFSMDGYWIYPWILAKLNGYPWIRTHKFEAIQSIPTLNLNK